MSEQTCKWLLKREKAVTAFFKHHVSQTNTPTDLLFHSHSRHHVSCLSDDACSNEGGAVRKRLNPLRDSVAHYSAAV